MTRFLELLELTYDLADRHVKTTDTNGTATPTDDTTTTYQRDPTGAIVSRTVDDNPALRHTSGPAGMAITTTTAGAIVERIIALPGGATARITGGQTWSYPNLAGSVAATANGNGETTGGTYTYDPYGNPLNGLPDNRQDNNDNTWLGATTEHTADIDLIHMGARLYAPTLGRFLQVDPKRGASANDYDYAAGDPINFNDITGTEPRQNHQCIHGCTPAPAAINPVGAAIRLSTYVGIYATTGDPKLAGQAVYGTSQQREAALRYIRKLQIMQWDGVRQYVIAIIERGLATNKYLAAAAGYYPAQYERWDDLDPAAQEILIMLIQYRNGRRDSLGNYTGYIQSVSDHFVADCYGGAAAGVVMGPLTGAIGGPGGAAWGLVLGPTSGCLGGAFIGGPLQRARYG